MEFNEVLDIQNPLHIECLRFCFGPMIKHDLEIYRKEWNEHSIRKQRARNIPGGKPNVMFKLPENRGLHDFRKHVNLQHVAILEEKYTLTPFLRNKKFIDTVNVILPELLTPATATDAFNLYQ